MAKKKTILDLQQMKDRGEQAAWMVLYAGDGSEPAVI